MKEHASGEQMPQEEPKNQEPERLVESFSDFTQEEQKEIAYKQKILSSLAYFIGKDFHIPVELNKPGAGWHWDFKNNIIRIDPKDLLEKPMEYLRSVIIHEGLHKLLSETEFIDMQEWGQPGYGFGLNVPEDGRINTAGAEYYPKFGEQLDSIYNQKVDFKDKAQEKAEKELGQQPRFMQAGFEILRLWFKWQKNEKMEVKPELSDEIKNYVTKMLPYYENFWRLFPTKEMVDGAEKDEQGLTGKKSIYRHSEQAYTIYQDEIWPEFKKLVDMDIEDQKMQEALKDMQKNQEEESSEDQDLSQELKDKLTQEEQEALKEALEKAIEKTDKKDESGEEESKAKQGSFKPVDLGSLSKELKQKIKEYVDSLPKAEQEEMEESTKARLKEFEDSLNAELEGKLSESPEEKAERELEEKEKPEKPAGQSKRELPKADQEKIKKYQEEIAEKLAKDANVYEKTKRELLPLIKKLEDDLRDIFLERRSSGWKKGFKTGKKSDIVTRIKEKAKGVPIIESKSWMRRELPQEKDYAFSFPNDLSGSMRGSKITEDFKSKIVIAEVLGRLSISNEILGYNDQLYEYKVFGDPMSRDVREKMGGILKEVDNEGARWNDDGWAVTQAAERLQKQKAKQKFLIVLSDGHPEESAKHSGPEYELSKVVKEIIKGGDIKVIGVGIQTDSVEHYYPTHIVIDDVKDMTEKLAKLLKDVIEHYDSF